MFNECLHRNRGQANNSLARLRSTSNAARLRCRQDYACLPTATVIHLPNEGKTLFVRHEEPEDRMTEDTTSSDMNEAVQPLKSTETPSKGVEVSALEQAMRDDIRKWAWGLLIFGTVSILLSGFLDPIWGGMLIIGGIVGFFVKKRGAFVVFGSVLILAALMNISSFKPGWIVLGVLQIYCAIQEFLRFRRYSEVRVTAGCSPAAPVVRGEKHSRLGLASLLLFSMAILSGVSSLVWAAIDVALHGIPDSPAQTPVVGVLLLLGCPLFAFVGTGVGIGGIAQRGRKRLLAIIGLSLNASLVIIVGGLIAMAPQGPSENEGDGSVDRDRDAPCLPLPRH
jgi:hypothetical protein